MMPFNYTLNLSFSFINLSYLQILTMSGTKDIMWLFVISSIPVTVWHEKKIKFTYFKSGIFNSTECNTVGESKNIDWIRAPGLDLCSAT